jgi:hypothetical protein
MKGFVIFYVNHSPANGDNIETMFNVIKTQNKELLDKLKNGGYDIMFVPTMQESTRVEKIDFPEPME